MPSFFMPKAISCLVFGMGERPEYGLGFSLYVQRCVLQWAKRTVVSLQP